MNRTYHAEVAALLAAGMAQPSRHQQAAARAEAREAREAIARFRQEWRALPAQR